MDEKYDQISLPTKIHKKEFKGVVKQHWNVTFAKQKRISVCAKRILAKVLAQIKDEDKEFKPYYNMHVTDVVTPGVDKTSAYKEVKKAFKELCNQVWFFEDLNTKEFVPRHLLDTTKNYQKDGFETAYKNGYLTIALNPALKNYFIELAHYSTYELKDYMTYKSWNTMRICEILSAFKDTGVWYVEIAEYRRIMDCDKKYEKISDLLKKTLSEPLKELAGTDLEFTKELIYGKAEEKKGRPSIIALKLLLKNQVPKFIPKAWRNHSPRHAKILDRLKHFKVSETNIIKYIRDIGIDQTAKIIREWEFKEISNDRINNRERYCNKVFVEVGKKMKQKITY